MELIYKKLLSKELDSLESNLLESISSDIELASEVSNYLVSSGGKRIRPVICILIAKTFNYSKRVFYILFAIFLIKSLYYTIKVHYPNYKRLDK